MSDQEDKSRVQGLVRRWSGRERSMSTPPVRARSTPEVAEKSLQPAPNVEVKPQAVPTLAVIEEASKPSLTETSGGSVKSRVRSYSQRMGVPLVSRLEKVCLFEYRSQLKAADSATPSSVPPTPSKPVIKEPSPRKTVLTAAGESTTKSRLGRLSIPLPTGYVSQTVPVESTATTTATSQPNLSAKKLEEAQEQVQNCPTSTYNPAVGG